MSTDEVFAIEVTDGIIRVSGDLDAHTARAWTMSSTTSSTPVSSGSWWTWPMWSSSIRAVCDR